MKEGLVQKYQIQMLADLTAEVFRVPKKRIRTLERYAAFTKEAMAFGDVDPEKIYQRSFQVGSRLRELLRLRTPQAKQRLVAWLYRNIGIAVEVRLPEVFLVKGCYFSRVYTPAECAVMSAMDSGIVAGIWGGGQLVFSERLTEGCGRCLACLKQGGQNE